MKQKIIWRSVLVIALSTTFGIAHAQTKFGIKAGIRYSVVTEKAKNGDKSDTELQLDLLIGVNLTGDGFRLQNRQTFFES